MCVTTRRARRHKTSPQIDRNLSVCEFVKMWRLLVRVDMRAHPNSRQTLRGLTDSRARAGARIGAFFDLCQRARGGTDVPRQHLGQDVEAEASLYFPPDA